MIRHKNRDVKRCTCKGKAPTSLQSKHAIKVPLELGLYDITIDLRIYRSNSQCICPSTRFCCRTGIGSKKCMCSFDEQWIGLDSVQAQLYSKGNVCSLKHIVVGSMHVHCQRPGPRGNCGRSVSRRVVKPNVSLPFRPRTTVTTLFFESSIAFFQDPGSELILLFAASPRRAPTFPWLQTLSWHAKSRRLMLVIGKSCQCQI